MKIIPGEISTRELHGYLLGVVSPRPICFASTVNGEGIPNLSPFSFFNAFGSNPPILIFSPARRVRDNTTKHTLENIRETGEVVINAVNYSMVQQVNLASCEYPKGINEFEKAGFTPLPSDFVRPFRVAESPAQLECKVLEVKETGTGGGAANLIICEVVCIHIAGKILNEEGKIDPHKIDLVARMGGDFYCRASGKALFTVAKPNQQLGMGIDALPESVRHSKILSGNDLAILANMSQIPNPADPENIREWIGTIPLQVDRHEHIHKKAKELIENKEITRAWQVLISEPFSEEDHEI